MSGSLDDTDHWYDNLRILILPLLPTATTRSTATATTRFEASTTSFATSTAWATTLLATAANDDNDYDQE